MSDDYMRYNLVTTFHCARCGDPLQLTYDMPKGAGGGYHPAADDSITGAAKVVQRVAIRPCAKCDREVREPLEALRKVLGLQKTADK